MLIHKLSTIAKIRGGDEKAEIAFQNTWTLFLDFGARL